MTLARRILGRASLVFFIALHVACLLVIAYPPTWPLVLLALASYMGSARQGFLWWEIDATYYTLRALSWLRVVRDLKEPPAWALAGNARARDAARRLAAKPATRVWDERP